MMKRFKLVVTHTIEVEIDGRVTKEGIDLGVQRTFHGWSDGRQPLSVELMVEGLQRTVSSLVSVAQGNIAGAICAKYKGATQKWWEIEKRLPPYAVSRIIPENDTSVELLEFKKPCSFCDAIPVTNECLETCENCGEHSFRVLHWKD